MKKVIAIALSVLLIVSLLPMAAFASDKTDEVYAKMEAARDYLYGKRTEFTAADGYDFLLFLYADGDGAPFKDAYVQSVKDAFDAGTMNTVDRISIAGLCLQELDVDVNEFKLNDGTVIDLEQKAVEQGLAVDSPYNYLFVNSFVDDDAFIEQVQNELTANYTKGSGYNYWGFSSDNSANFAVMTFDDELEADAVSVVESAKTDKGYYYLADYGTTANGNSTATALFMYANLAGLNPDGELDTTKADEVYQLLVDNFTTADGSYSFELGGEPNNYATRDALKALIDYYALCCEADAREQESKSDTDKPAQQTTEAKSTGAQKQSTPATGDSLVACGIAAVAVIALGGALALRKKEEK